MLNRVKSILLILLSVVSRLTVLFLLICGIWSNTDTASFSTAAEIDYKGIIFFGQLTATYLMTFIGIGFYPLCVLFIFSFALPREKKVLFVALILIAITLLAKLPPSDGWLFGSYGGILGSLLANNLQHVYAVHSLAALMLLIILRIFNVLTTKKIRKILKRVLRIIKGIITLPFLWIRKKLKFSSQRRKEGTPKRVYKQDDTDANESPGRYTYDLIKKDKLPTRTKEINSTATNNPSTDRVAAEVATSHSEFNSVEKKEIVPPKKGTPSPDREEFPLHKDDSTEKKNVHDEIGNQSPPPKKVLPSREESTLQKTQGSPKSFTQERSQKGTIPSLDFLEKHNHELKHPENAQKEGETLKKALEDFKIECKIVNITVGPVVTLYELQPAAGIKSSTIISLSADVARTMSAVSARISIIPGRNVIGIELPNKNRETVFLREILESQQYQAQTKTLPITLGKSINGEPIVVDLAKMPHLLIAGTTGSGKSVGVNAMILSLIYKLEPHECKLIMIDPKMLELSIYNDIPHLLSPVVTDPKKAVVALKWVVKEMERRYKLMTKLAVRNIEGYNKKVQEGKTFEYEEVIGIDPTSGEKLTRVKSIELEKLAFIVVVVDEMADLMLVAGKEIETSIQRLAQMARASGIHLIMATQRPSVDVITGVIKANFPTRISFAVTSKIDSRTILGEQGAEQLLGRGDMLYMASGRAPIRVHGPYVSDTEVERVVEYLKQVDQPQYDESIMIEEGPDDESMTNSATGENIDSLYNQAIEIVRRDNKVSISYIQRRLSIGYNKAAKLVEKMEEDEIVSPPNNAGKRTLL